MRPGILAAVVKMTIDLIKLGRSERLGQPAALVHRRATRALLLAQV
jgi:hypothetical protein